LQLDVFLFDKPTRQAGEDNQRFPDQFLEFADIFSQLGQVDPDGESQLLFENWNEQGKRVSPFTLLP